MQPGIHYPDKSKPDLSAVTNLMSSLRVNDRQSAFEATPTLSMTGVNII